MQPVLDRFRDYKRSAALLDFDDLIFAARDLLRDHDAVRRALAARFAHVLVDEFQDTDPLQTEIFWRLCGEPRPVADEPTGPRSESGPARSFWSATPSRRSIASAARTSRAYIQARDAFVAQDADSVLSISTNFRSCAPILTLRERALRAPAVGRERSARLHRAGLLSIPIADEALCVAALDVAVADEDGKASAEQQRDGEAEAVAEMCARLIGSEDDPRSQDRRAPSLQARRHRASRADRKRSVAL